MKYSILAFLICIVSIFSMRSVRVSASEADDLRESVWQFEVKTGWTVWFSLYYSKSDQDFELFDKASKQPDQVRYLFKRRAVFHQKNLILTDSSGYSDVLESTGEGESYFRGVKILNVATPLQRGTSINLIFDSSKYTRRSYSQKVEPEAELSTLEFLDLFEEKCFWLYDEKIKKWSLRNRNGFEASKLTYDDVDTFSCDAAPVCINEKWRYIDRSENLIGNKVFDEAFSFRNGLARIRLGMEWYIINPRIEIIAGPFENVRDLSYGLILAKKHGNWGAVDRNGKSIIGYLYSSIEVSDEYVIALTSSSASLFDKDGHLLASSMYPEKIDTGLFKKLQKDSGKGIQQFRCF